MQRSSSHQSRSINNSSVAQFTMLAFFCIATIGCGGGDSKSKDPLAKIKRYSDPALQATAAIKKANSLVKKGDKENATAALDIAHTAIGKVEDDIIEQAKLWVAIAGGYHKLGSKTKSMKALRTARKMSSKLEPSEKASLLAKIAGGYMDIDDMKLAKSLLSSAASAAEKIEDPEKAIEALLALADTSNKMSDAKGENKSYTKAVKVAQGVESAEVKVELLCKIASTQIKNSKKDLAVKNLKLAHAAASEIPVEGGKNSKTFKPHIRANSLMNIIDVYIALKSNKSEVNELLKETNGFVKKIVKPALETEAMKRWLNQKAKSKNG